MLDRTKLVAALHQVSNKLFIDNALEYEIALASWLRLCQDPVLLAKLAQADSPWPLPMCVGSLDAVSSISPFMDDYQVLAVDGSQIYPDRHQGTGCFLINIGSVHLSYSRVRSHVSLSTMPFVYSDLNDQELTTAGSGGSTELVNNTRSQLELKHLLMQAMSIKHARVSSSPLLLMMDGSLIFWHLEGQDRESKQRAAAPYMHLLDVLHHERLWYCAYASMPKNREIINVVRMELCNFDLKNNKYPTVEHVIDAHLAQLILEPGMRTPVFKSTVSLTDLYPEHAKPHFVYLNVGPELARIEFPAWIALDSALVDMLCSISFDQAIKGNGYPVALAEAHEQAVVKAADREFFYTMLSRMGVDYHQRFIQSRKSIKKRLVGI